MPESHAASIEINAIPEELFEIVTDLESYPEWLDGFDVVTVLDEDADGFPAASEMIADVKIRKVRYTLDYEYDYPSRVWWKSRDGGDVKLIEGGYTFEPLDDESTRVEYELTIDPGFPVPGFLVKQAAKQIMQQALTGLKSRAESA